MKSKFNLPYCTTSIIFLLTMLASCTRQATQLNISFHEISFDEELSCVGMINDSTCFVGSEHGSIYILKNGKVEKALHSNEARIYDVLQAEDDTMYVGIRNTSIAKIQIPYSGDKQYSRLSPLHFTIPIKGERYSVYGFAALQGNIFAATSNGLYYFSANESGETVSMKHVKDTNHAAGQPFVFCSPVVVNNGNEVCFATDSGLVKINGTYISQSTTSNYISQLDGKKLLKLVKEEKSDTLFALSEKYVYKVASNNMNVVDSAMLDGFTALSMEIAMGKLYFVNETSLHVARSFNDLKNNRNIVKVDLPHHVPSNTRNVIVYDSHERMIRIVTDRALLSFPALNAIGESENNITHTCIDKKTGVVYFLNVENELYKWKDKTGVAHKIMQLPDADKVASIYANNGIVYYVTSTSNMMKAVKENFFSRFYCLTYDICKLEKSLTAMLCTGNRAYIGIRDLLKVHDLSDRKHSVVLKNIKDPYVTRLVEHEDDVFAITLNDGIWVLKDTIAHYIEGTNEIHFMNDIAFINESQMLLLNNHYLYKLSYNPKDSKLYNVEKIDSISGYERIFIVKSDSVKDEHTVMLVSKYDTSILHINKDATKLVPIKALNNQNIQPDGCMDLGDYKLIAADGGILLIDNNKLLTGDDELYNWRMFLKFDLSDYDKTRNMIFLIISIITLLLLAGGIYITNERKRMKREVRLIALKHSKQLAEIANTIKQAAQLLNKEDLLTRTKSMIEKIEKYSNDTQEEEAKKYRELNSELHVLMLEAVNNMKGALKNQCKELEEHNYNNDLILMTKQSVETQSIKVLMESFNNNSVRLKEIESIYNLAKESPAWNNIVQHEVKVFTDDSNHNNWQKFINSFAEMLQQLFKGHAFDELKIFIDEQIKFTETAKDIEDGTIINAIKLRLESLKNKIATINHAETKEQTEWLLAIKNETEQLLLANCLGNIKDLAQNYNIKHKIATKEYKESLEENLRKEIKTFYKLEKDHIQIFISISTGYRDFYPLFLTGAIKGKSSHYVKVVFPSQESNDDLPRLAKFNLKKKLKEKEKLIVNYQEKSSDSYGLAYYLKKYLNNEENS